MNASIQARLDKEAQAALRVLVKRHSWSPSQAVRESLVEMARQKGPAPKRRIIGVGIADTGISDLSTNERHMKDLGK